jgi:hypothetical protein
MKFEVETLFEGSSDLDFYDVFNDLNQSLVGISEAKIEAFFRLKAVGARSKSLAGTVRTLVLNDLQFKGWEIKWCPFKGNLGLESASWNFDAAKLVEKNGSKFWVTLEISFDNRVAIGTHLVKSKVANNPQYRSDASNVEIAHHCIISAAKSFKEVAGIDSSVASAEEFRIAAGPYAIINPPMTTLVSLTALETIEISQRKYDGRTKSTLLNLSGN